MSNAFVSPIPAPLHRAKRSVCQRRSAIVASADNQSGASWENTPNYQMLGTGIQSKGLQTIEFSIRPNGIIEEKVTGVRGKDCQKLTEKIEKALGTVVSVKKTSEYYQEEVVVEENVERNSDNQQYSWPGSEGYPTW